MSEKKNVLRYELIVRGVFGRNRKAKFDTFKLGANVDPATPRTLEDVLPLARAKLAEIKFKAGRWCVEEQPIELNIYDEPGGPVTLESFVLMSGKKIHEETV